MKTLMVMMVLMVPVSGLPLTLNDTRQNDQIFMTSQLRNEQENSTRLEFPQISNSTNIFSWIRNITTGNMANNIDVPPFILEFPQISNSTNIPSWIRNITTGNMANNIDVPPFINVTLDNTRNDTDVSPIMNITPDIMSNNTVLFLTNITSDHMRNETGDSMLINIMSDSLNNTDVSPLMNITADTEFSPFMMFLPQDIPRPPRLMPIGRGCPLPTCQTVNLGDALQTGDETAGKEATSDPFGIGKK